ncbi:MAG: polymerase [Spirochaetaceae bacterium]|jgi:hypothetical protein|nr:polymerase [Spirochaetaceae bacterium]
MKNAKRLFLCAAALALCAAETGTLSAVLDWTDMKIDVSVAARLDALGLALPAGRVQAGNALFDVYYAKITRFLYAIPVDSSSTMGDLVERGELSPAVVDDIILNARNVPPTMSSDLRRVASSHVIVLNEVQQALMEHGGEPADFERLINPPAVPAYTGLVVIADAALPVHGRQSSAYLQPCLFPKIWDAQMNLVYDKKFVNPEVFQHSTFVHYAASESVFRRTPSGLSPELEKIVGDKPLKIIARGVFGARPTDPVIDAEDALLILASQANRALLREGRVALISSADALKLRFSE